MVYFSTWRKFADVAQDVLKYDSGCSDRIVPLNKLDFQSLSKIWIRDNFHYVKPQAQRQLCRFLGPKNEQGNHIALPHSYLEKCPPAQQANHLNYWLQKARQDRGEFFVRFDPKDCIRAVFSTRYQPFDNSDIISELGRRIPNDEDVRTRVDDNFFQIEVPADAPSRRAVADNPDSVFKTGITVWNSETGLSSYAVAPMILVLVCTNGMVGTRHGEISKYRHIRSQHSERFNEILTDALELASNGIGDTFQKLHSIVVEDPLAVIESYRKKYGVTEDEKQYLEYAYEHEAPTRSGQQATMYNVVQTFTRVGNDHRLDPHRQSEFQRIGGRIAESLVEG